MVKTTFTRNGREVMIWGAMRNFDYGSEEAVQQSKKGGKGGDGSASKPKGAAKKGGKGGDGSVSEPKGAAKKGGKRGASVSLGVEDKAWDTIWVACVISREGYEAWDTIWWFNSVS
ncbi:hypothetical protein Bca4012_049572 [Brassica carinata]